MIQTLAAIDDVEAEGNGPFVRVTVSSSEVCRSLSAGRFLLADLGGLLRQAIFPASVGHDQFEVLVPAGHPAAGLTEGSLLSLIGPLGRGYEVPAQARRLLLIADTGHLPVLLPLVHPDLNAEREVTLLLLADAAAHGYPLRLLPPSVEVHILRSDSPGIDLPSSEDVLGELVAWADHACLATNRELYPLIAQAVRKQRLLPATRFAEALMSPLMACGVGACRGCAVATTRGPRLACTDGPVFDLLELQGR